MGERFRNDRACGDKMPNLIDDLRKARQNAATSECIAVCRRGLCADYPRGSEEWYAVRINLATLLSQDDKTNELTSQGLEEAIDLYRAIIDAFQDATDSREVANAAMGLGWAYYLRVQGSPDDNLQSAQDAFYRATKYYTRERDQYTWACLQDALGLIFSGMNSQNHPHAQDTAIERYREALKVFSKESYPDEWVEINEKIDLLKEKKGDRSI